MENIVQTLQSIVIGLTGSSCEVEILNDERGTLLTIIVDKENIGKIIGKEGKTIDSIRTIIKNVGAVNDKAVGVKVYDPAKIF